MTLLSPPKAWESKSIKNGTILTVRPISYLLYYWVLSQYFKGRQTEKISRMRSAKQCCQIYRIFGRSTEFSVDLPIYRFKPQIYRKVTQKNFHNLTFLLHLHKRTSKAFCFGLVTGWCAVIPGVERVIPLITPLSLCSVVEGVKVSSFYLCLVIFYMLRTWTYFFRIIWL
jgi:hypothetical protein